MGVVLTETRDRIRLISLNRPDRHNAMDDAALDQFGEALTAAARDAATALGWGLVDEVVSPEELDATALTLCREIAGHSNSALQSSKQLVDHAWRGTIVNGIRAELHAQVALFSSAEFASLMGQHAGKK